MEYTDLVAVTEINKCRDSDGKEESEVEKSWSPTICFFLRNGKYLKLRKDNSERRKNNSERRMQIRHNSAEKISIADMMRFHKAASFV